MYSHDYPFIGLSASNEFLPPVSECTCPGDVLTYTCTVVGGGATLWSGTAFSCSNTRNEILLRHSRFSVEGGAFGDCTNGDLVGRSLSVQDNCYTSQLNVTVSLGLNGRTVECTNDIMSTEMAVVGRSTITTGIKLITCSLTCQATCEAELFVTN